MSRPKRIPLCIAATLVAFMCQHSFSEEDGRALSSLNLLPAGYQQPRALPDEPFEETCFVATTKYKMLQLCIAT